MTTDFQHEVAPIETAYGNFDFHCFSWGPHEEDNVLCLAKRPFQILPLVRIQSACYSAEIFRSTDCDCHEQLEISLHRIAGEGGLLIYMLCDGRGAGLLRKVRGLALGKTSGLDTHDAYLHMGIPLDGREYDRAVAILNFLKCDRVRLLTNNPKKIDGLAQHGIAVERAALEIPSTTASAPYLRTKATKMGHILREFESS